MLRVTKNAERVRAWPAVHAVFQKMLENPAGPARARRRARVRAQAQQHRAAGLKRRLRGGVEIARQRHPGRRRGRYPVAGG